MYEIIKVDHHMRAEVARGEYIGARKKFWVKLPDRDEEWLFKHPRENRGEHWAEKVAYEIARFLGIECAVVELAEYRNKKGGIEQGTICRSFISGEEKLTLGNVLLWRNDKGYDKENKGKVSKHSVDNILSVLGNEKLQNKDAAKKQFIKYVLLDAIIGNTDRHHRNWGCLHRSDGANFRLAPSYDHASSLGRDIAPARKEAILKCATGIADYADDKRARSAIYLDEADERPADRVDLVEKFCARCGVESVGDIVPQEALEKLADEKIHQIINDMPKNWMSDIAQRFAVELVKYNIRSRILPQLTPITPKMG